MGYINRRTAGKFSVKVRRGKMAVTNLCRDRILFQSGSQEEGFDASNDGTHPGKPEAVSFAR